PPVFWKVPALLKVPVAALMPTLASAENVNVAPPLFVQTALGLERRLLDPDRMAVLPLALVRPRLRKRLAELVSRVAPPVSKVVPARGVIDAPMFPLDQVKGRAMVNPPAPSIVPPLSVTFEARLCVPLNTDVPPANATIPAPVLPAVPAQVLVPDEYRTV